MLRTDSEVSENVRAGCMEKRDILIWTKQEEMFSGDPYWIRKKSWTSAFFHCVKGPDILHQASKLLVLYLETKVDSVNNIGLPVNNGLDQNCDYKWEKKIDVDEGEKDEDDERDYL